MSSVTEKDDYLPIDQWCVLDDAGAYHLVIFCEAENTSGARHGTRADVTNIDLLGERWIRADGSDEFVSPNGRTARRVPFVRTLTIATRPTG